MRRQTLPLIITLVCGLLAACATPEATPEELPEATESPTDVPQPTNTPEPTPTPTQVPPPTPVPVSAFIPDTTIVSAIDFDAASPMTGDWWFGPKVSVIDGLLTLEADPSWTSAEGGTVQDGQTLLARFIYRQGASVEIGIAGGEHDTSSYKVLTLAEYSESAYFRPQIAEYSDGDTVWSDQSWTSFNLNPIPDHWYLVMVYAGGEEGFVLRMWDEENPALYREAQLTFPDDWANKTWWIRLVAGPGTNDESGFDVDRIEILDGLPDLAALTAE